MFYMFYVLSLRLLSALCIWGIALSLNLDVLAGCTWKVSLFLRLYSIELFRGNIEVVLGFFTHCTANLMHNFERLSLRVSRPRLARASE